MEDIRDSKLERVLMALAQGKEPSKGDLKDFSEKEIIELRKEVSEMKEAGMIINIPT